MLKKKTQSCPVIPIFRPGVHFLCCCGIFSKGIAPFSHQGVTVCEKMLTDKIHQGSL